MIPTKRPATARNILTTQSIKAAKPAAKPYRMRDGGGLAVLVQPEGGKLWQYRYELAGKAKIYSIGPISKVTLAEARVARDAAEKLVRSGHDPVAAKRSAKAATIKAEGETFGYFAAIVMKRMEKERDPKTVKCYRIQLGYAVAIFGDLPIASIRRPMVLEFLRRFEALNQITTMHATKRKIAAVFHEAIAAEACDHNPAVIDVGRLRPEQHKHFPAITEPAAFGELLRRIDAYTGKPATVALLKLMPLLFQRSEEMRLMRWAEIDWTEALWEIPASRMKKTRGPARAHNVPLSNQALAILRDIQALTGRGEFVFPGATHAARTVSKNAVNMALGAIGYGAGDHCAHGFRSSASTMLRDRVRFPDWVIDRNDVIETQLAHVTGNSVGRAYNRSHLLEPRRWMMQAWADLCDTMRQGAEIVPIGGHAPARRRAA